MLRDDWEQVLIYIGEKAVDTNETYWHYTSLRALLLMFKVDMNSFKKCEVLASNIRFLNDTQEYLEGETFLKQQGAKIKGVGEDIYIISFCENGDLLSQWQYYAKDSGIAVGFKLSNAQYVYYNCSSGDMKEQDDKTRPLQCYYNKYDELYQDLQENLGQNEQLLPPLFIPLCKNNAFQHEKESRLVFYTIADSDIRFDFDYNTNNPIKIKPALRVQFLAKDSKKRLIDKIIVGPGENQNTVFNTLIHIFDRDNYKFYDDEKFKADTSAINESQYKDDKNYYSDIQLVEWEEGGKTIKRWSYKCANGIIIMKSSIPFRG